MRVKVGKQSRKAIQFYRINFNFREPYKIILDGNFIKVSLDKKVELRTKLEKVLGGKILLATTPCVLSELNQLGDDFRGTFIAARRFPKEKCKHTGTIEASACIKLLIGEDNPDKLVLASQDAEFVGEMRSVPGVPIVQLLQGKLLVHEPSNEVKEKLEKELKERGGPTQQERQILKPVIRKMKEEERQKVRDKIKKQRNSTGVKMKKKAKGANPLSRLKKNPELQQRFTPAKI